MNTLTDRYVWAVVRLLPDGERDEIEQEVRELVTEVIDNRSSAVEVDDLDVERAALHELGDPRRMAARYANRPLPSLVGPERFPEYVRALKLAWLIAVPVVTGLVVIGAATDDDATLGRLLAAAAAALYGGTVLVAFWVTLAYAFPERWNTSVRWTVDELPDAPAPAASKTLNVADTVLGIVATILVATALVLQHLWPLVREDGEGIPVLDPSIWDGAGQGLLALLVASLVVQSTALVRRRWNYVLAGLNAAINATSLAIVARLAIDQRLINTDVLAVLADRAERNQGPTVDPWIPIVLVGAVQMWDTVQALSAARRATAR